MYNMQVMITVCVSLLVWLDAVISLPAYCPTVFSHLAVHLHGSSLADDQQAADGGRGAGAAVECQDTRRAFLCLLQQHWADPVREMFVLKALFIQNCKNSLITHLFTVC